jgi:hypothetical protein
MKNERFKKWWRKVHLPWWSHGNPSLNPAQHRDMEELCMKAYKLGIKHSKENATAQTPPGSGTKNI